MATDPETLSYLSVEERLFEVAAAAYQQGLSERLAARGITTIEQLPRLAVVGYSDSSDTWTRIATSQGTGWFINSRIEGPALIELAKQLGDSDGDDWWAEV